MEFLAVFLFVISLLGIVGLFAKRYEEREGRTLFPALRAEADVRALELKAKLQEMQQKVSRVGPFTVRFTRMTYP